VGWEGNDLPRAVVTGTPVRPDIAAVDRSPSGRAEARRALGLPVGRGLVVVFGGSLGARQINRAVDGAAERWADRDDLAVYHIVGRRDWGAYCGDPSVERLPAAGDDRVDTGAGDGPAHRGGAAGGGAAGGCEGLELVRVPYEQRMAAVYAAADVVVSRAGAMTVAELATSGTPAVLVPLPGAPGDHQTANARVLERAGAAVLLPDADCTPAGLVTTVDGLLADPDRLGAMGRAAKSVGRPDAADAGARVVEANARPEDRSRDGAGGRGRDVP
jgi:UDP-N-acetylglucosamine:LPS N-acetylglucosamine transferase